MRYLERVRLQERGKIWELFTDLPRVTGQTVNTLEIINTANRGKISLDDTFTLAGYAASMNRRSKLAKINHWKTVSYIVSDDSESDTQEHSSYGISESLLPTTASGEMLEFVSSDFKKQVALSEVREIGREHKEWGIQVDVTVINAIKGIPSAVAVLKSFLQNYPQYKPRVLALVHELI